MLKIRRKKSSIDLPTYIDSAFLTQQIELNERNIKLSLLAIKHRQEAILQYFSSFAALISERNKSLKLLTTNRSESIDLFADKSALNFFL